VQTLLQKLGKDEKYVNLLISILQSIKS